MLDLKKTKLMKVSVSRSDCLIKMIQKNQVTNGHLQKLNMKLDSNLCLETKLHVDSFSWHQTLNEILLEIA